MKKLGRTKDKTAIVHPLAQARCLRQWGNSNGTVETTINYSFQVDFSVANSMDEVGITDHLLVIVDDVLGKSAKGGEAGGLAKIRGKIAYAQGANIGTGIHEVGHNMGLIHTFEETPPYNDASNYMNY